MTRLLASVATLDEMDVARLGGADIVDLKDPSRGALGAWSETALREAFARWRGWPAPRPLLSATIGDQPMAPGLVLEAAERVAATGVPIVKLGLLSDGDTRGCIESLRGLASRARLIAVFFADLGVDLSLLDHAAATGFHGAMIDTADKAAGGLRHHLDAPALAQFLARAKALGLLTGLAGSLRLEDVAPLAVLRPDYLGFRGALCEGGRQGRIDLRAVEMLSRTVLAKREAA